MQDTIIYPTHTCFDDALDLLIAMLKDEPNVYARGSLVARLRLVHARCLAPDGHSYAHAWVENISIESPQCYFVGIVNDQHMALAAPTSEYHATVRMQESIRYTYPEALRLNRTSGHYGPWTPELQALCRGGTNSWAAGATS